MVPVGQRLREERQKKGLTIDEVAKATKIRSSFLTAIENGQYAKLPSGAYVQGFVKNYVEFLGLPKKELIPLFKREFNDREFLKVLPEGLSHKDNLSMKGFRLNQTIVIGVIVSVLLSGFLLFQYRYAIINPPLEISEPSEDQVVEKTVEVFGKTDPNATVSINDALVSLEKDGTFRKTISLFPGKSTIKVESKNRFGHKTHIERHVEVKGE